MSQTDLSTRLARLVLKLQGYKFSIQHRSGSQNIVPDALSRTNTEDLNSLSVFEITNPCDYQGGSGMFVDLRSPYFKSNNYIELLEKVGKSLDKMPDLRIIDGYLYRRMELATGEQIKDDLAWKLWIPKEMIPEVLKKPMMTRCQHMGESIKLFIF